MERDEASGQWPGRRHTPGGERTFAALRAEIADAEARRARTPVRIRVTKYALPGSVTEVPVLGHDGRLTGERELRVTPEDWDELREEMPADIDVLRVSHMWGIPVVIDP